ncbi:hypothetical protein FHS10_003201 [Mucilaginibacter dorajii]|nr:hypothetical protein [Mucilaginibacter dorajii]
MTIHLRLNDYKGIINNKTLYTKAYRVSFLVRSRKF